MSPTEGAPPNPRLQRTRSAPLRSPLSRKPLATQKRVFVATVLACLASAMPAALFACSCGHKETALESLGNSTRVFEGEPLWVEPAWATVPHAGFKFPLRRWRFRVLKVWKGGPTREAQVVDAFGNCSYGFRPGKIYLVFGAQHPTIPDSLHTTICTATREVNEGNSQELGQGTVVDAPRPLGPEPLLRRARRVFMTSWYMGMAFVGYQWRELKENNPAGALFVSYVSAVIALLLALLAIRSSFRGHFKRVALVVGVASIVVGAALLALGGWHASRNPFLNELIRLGG